MPRFLLKMSAVSNGEIIHNSYIFESNLLHTEYELIQSYQEYYAGQTDVRVLSFTELIGDELVQEHKIA
jgi:hypothetical protein